MAESPRVDIVNEAIAMVDTGLVDLQRRELVSAQQVADLLLDLRLLLVSAAVNPDRPELAVP
jgi:hypothetical protein